MGVPRPHARCLPRTGRPQPESVEQARPSARLDDGCPPAVPIPPRASQILREGLQRAILVPPEVQPFPAGSLNRRRPILGCPRWACAHINNEMLRDAAIAGHASVSAKDRWAAA